MKKSNLVLLLFILLSSISLRAMELRQYCFKRNVSLERVKIYLNQIKLEKDLITLNRARHCVEIGVGEDRVELFQKYLSMNYQFEVMGNSAVRKRECLFEIETLRESEKNTKSIKFGSKIHIGEKQKSNEGKSVSMIRVMEQKLAQLFVNDTLITISCQIRGKFTEVDINLGNKRTNLITTIQVSKGQRVDLGSIVQDLSSKDSGVSLSKGINYSKSSGSKKSSVFLILK